MALNSTLNRNHGKHGYAGRKLAPMIEIMESRQLLTSGSGIIAGTAFYDLNNDGKLSVNDTYKAGATILLFQNGSTTPLASTVTDSKGGYQFTGLAPGDYVVVEPSSSTYTATGTEIRSQFMPAGQVSANSMEVIVPAANQVYVNYSGITPNLYQVVNDVTNGTSTTDAIGQLRIALGTSAGKNDLSGQFLSFCLNEQTRIPFDGGISFQVTPKPITQLDNNGVTISADHAGRIAYLYNHFGTSSLTNIQGPALQLAIWELLYDTSDTPDFSSGNFKITGPVSPTDAATLDNILIQAKAYYNQSAGKSEAAIFLQANSTINNGATEGFQSMIATGSFNFANKPITPSSSISGYVYCDDNNDGLFEKTEEPIANVPITLTGHDQSGKSVTLVTTTDQTGAYHFLNLTPGSYSITETQPAGYINGKTTQGTPGTGVATINAINNIQLAANVNGQNNNFGELGAPVYVTNLQLFGIHHQTSQIVLTLDGALDPVQAQNPANYRLIGLGKDERIGTADDVVYGISSIVYNPQNNTVTLTPNQHLNIHYHYVLSLTLPPANPCSPTVQYTNVFGRAAVPVFTMHGVTKPAPAMTPTEIAHNATVVQQTWQYINSGKLTAAAARYAAIIKAAALRNLLASAK